MLALFLGLSTMAQNSKYEQAKLDRVVHKTILDQFSPTQPTETVPFLPKAKKATAGDLELVTFGTSLNGYTLLHPTQRGLWYNKDLNAIVATFRGNQNSSVQPIFATGNDIVQATSLDGGATWTRQIVLENGTDGKLNRYPGGALLNPVGNTDINNAVHLVGGISSVNSKWTEYYLATSLHDGTGANLQRGSTSANTFNSTVSDITACEDGSVHTLATYYEYPNNIVTNATIIVRNGTYNSSTKQIDWMADVIIKPDVVPSPTTAEQLHVGETRMTWSNDGSIGYIVTIGVDVANTAKNGMYPIIFKSTDKGATWTQLPYFDFALLDAVQENVWPAWTSDGMGDLAIPYFNELDATIAADGSLNLIASIRGNFYVNPDSVGYIFVNEHDYIFNFVYDGTTWDGYFVKRLDTFTVTDETSPYQPSTAMLYDTRIHAVRSHDGKKIFGVWTNTFAANSEVDSADTKPDVFIWGYKIGDDHVIKEMVPFSPTTWTAADASCFYMFASPICMDIADGQEFPIWVADIATTGNNPDNPCILNYLKNVVVMDEAFTNIRVGVQPLKEVFATVSGNYPNPFSGITQFDITLKKTVPVSITVLTITGQKVFAKNYGVIAAGQKETLQIDASNLKSGVYIYTVTAGESKSSHKMIVK